MENRSNVNVFLRLRPPQLWELQSPIKTFIDFEKSTNKMFLFENNPYCFDKIFYSNANNKDIFKDLEANVDHLMDGYNNCVLAYGQSGAGKTFTMGLNEKNDANRGLISLSLNSLFEKIREKQLTNVEEEYSVSVSFIEIYNEKVYDLFSEKSGDSIHTKGSKYAGSTKIAIKNWIDAKELLLKGNKNRHVRSTALNAMSSRSHAMFSVLLHATSKNAERVSVLHLIDLAGSEGLRKTNHSGVAQTEGVHINQGLLAVCKVVQALSNGKSVVPYRDSILTTVLQDCLSLDSYFTLIACISPARKDRAETLSTIRFAQSCKNMDSKMLPEVNAYLKEKQRLNARTPLHSNTLSTIRKDKAKTPGKFADSSNKIVASTARKPLSVNRFHSFATPSTKITQVSQTRYTDLAGVADSRNMSRLQVPKESMDNQTFNIMNVSCSTEVDEPMTSHMNSNGNLTNFQTITTIQSFSPLLKRIEETIDKKLANFMGSFLKSSLTVDTTIVHQKVKDAVKSGICEVRNSLNANDSIMVNSVIDTTNEPIFSTVQRNTIKTNQNQENIDSTVVKDSEMKANPTNRCLFNFTADSPNKIAEGVQSEVYEFSTATTSINNKPIRATRRSTRIHDMRKVLENKTDKTIKIEEKVLPTVKRQVVKNEISASYFNNLAATIKNVTKKDHKSAIMGMINNGSIKDLQLLPTIGVKTAYQIVTHRAVKGKFQSLNEFKKALKFKDKAWDNFLEKNLLK